MCVIGGLHLFTNAELDCGGVFIEALQQLSRPDVHIKVGSFLSKHRLKISPPETGGLP